MRWVCMPICSIRSPPAQVVLPQRRVPLQVAVAAEDVVDQHVEPALLGLDRATSARDGWRGPRGRRRARRRSRRRRRSGRRCPRWSRAGRSRSDRDPAAAAGGIDERSGPGQLDSDRPARPAGGAGDQGDPAGQGCAVGHRFSSSMGWPDGRRANHVPATLCDLGARPDRMPDEGAVPGERQDGLMKIITWEAHVLARSRSLRCLEAVWATALGRSEGFIG